MARDLTFSRWLRRARSARFETQDAARAAYRAAGMDIGQAEYSMWEGGSRTPRLTNPKRRFLEKFYGGAVEAVPSGDMTVLLAAMQVQTVAINRLADEIALSRKEELVTRQEMMKTLGSLAKGRVLRGTPVEDGHGTREDAPERLDPRPRRRR